MKNIKITWFPMSEKKPEFEEPVLFLLDGQIISGVRVENINHKIHASGNVFHGIYPGGIFPHFWIDEVEFWGKVTVTD